VVLGGAVVAESLAARPVSAAGGGGWLANVNIHIGVFDGAGHTRER
jgi:hypothetical protein